jgi:hypothetical protein
MFRSVGICALDGMPFLESVRSQKRPDGWHFEKGESHRDVWAAWFRDLVKLAILTGTEGRAQFRPEEIRKWFLNELPARVARDMLPHELEALREWPLPWDQAGGARWPRGSEWSLGRRARRPCPWVFGCAPAGPEGQLRRTVVGHSAEVARPVRLQGAVQVRRAEPVHPVRRRHCPWFCGEDGGRRKAGCPHRHQHEGFLALALPRRALLGLPHGRRHA